MEILLVFAFLSGLITIFAPCIWPLLPLILGSSVTGGHKKPLGVVLGIVISFGILTLSLSYIIQIIPFDPNTLRLVSVIIIGFLGLTLLIPRLAQKVEGYVSRLSGSFAQKFVGKNINGFWGGFVTGLALGIIWTPCAGPILATIATLAATNTVNANIILVTAVYMIGIAIPLFLFALLGRYLFTKTRVFSKYTGKIQQIFGAIMILTAILIFTNYDKVLQAKLLDYFPSYGNFLIDLESNEKVEQQLDKIRKNEATSDNKTSTSDGLFNEQYKAPEVTGITNWINLPEGSQTPKLSEFRGKVVLIDFWTYTCINCIRTLPYLTSWDEKYRENGLVIIGVHTPEFEFEKDTQNVIDATKQYNITYPVAQDNNYSTWKTFKNRYWPAKYLIDKDGIVRRTHFGEGEYEETEKAIQILLNETGSSVSDELVDDKSSFNRNITLESYLGSSRMSYYHPNGNISQGQDDFNLNINIPLNSFSLGGTWNIMPEYAKSIKNSVLELNFRAQNVYLVMRSSDSKPKKVKVFLDDLAPGVSAGKDAKGGIVNVDSDRLYELINLPQVENKKLRIEFEDGIEIFAFTFG